MDERPSELELRGERVTLRPADEEDVPGLLAILREPEVARWWGPYDAEQVREELPGSFAVLAEGALAGWLLVDEEDDPDYPSVAFDIGLTTALHGHGYGREVLRVAIRHFADRGHHRFTIDPAVGNERAIRCYAAVGFKPVGVLRAYERVADGWRDGLLMDLLADELRG
jgi:aminoglycoside 6'-N-acetyltransferase